MSTRRVVPFAFVAMALALAVAPAVAADEPALKVGDAAPKLHIGEWVQGEPVAEFEKGRVYVVEFWATWCGPCRAIIPHMSKLAEAYKAKGAAITFIGVNIWEGKPDAVKKFVAEMGETMTYTVAIDEGGREGKTAKAWMTGGQGGIPTAFVVGGDGKIAWIGHPGQIDAVLEAIVAGDFDPAKHAERDAKAQALQQRLVEAIEAGEVDAAAAVIDELAAVVPDSAAQAGALKFRLYLVNGRYKDAYAIARRVYEGPGKDDANVLNEISWTILDEEGVQERDYELAMKIAVRANEVAKGEDAAILDTLARAHFDTGNIAQAIRFQRLSVAKAPAELRDEVQQTLERYENATQVN